MRLDFPDAPTDGENWLAPNGVTYRWDGTKGLWTTINVPLGNRDLGWRLIDRIVPSAGQEFIDFTDLPADIDDLEVRYDATPQTNGSHFVLRFYDAAGVLDSTPGNYTSINMYTYNGAAPGSNVTAYPGPSPSTGIIINLFSSGWGVSSAEAIQGRLSVNNIRDGTRRKFVTFQSVQVDGNNLWLGSLNGTGQRNVKAPISGLRLGFDSSNYAAGGAVSLWASSRIPNVSGGGGGGSAAVLDPGIMVDFAGSVAPAGWYLCDGSLKSRTEDAALWKAIGTLYGAGDGSTTFALPDCRHRVTAMRDDAEPGFEDFGTKLGALTHTLGVTEIPAHSHAFQGDNFRGVGAGSFASVQSGSGSIIYYADNTSQFAGGTVGGGQPHSIVQPTLIVNKIIKR